MSNPIVTIEMEGGGVMKAELYPGKAPNTVNNFISLIQKGFYDGLTFHRCIPGFMIQGGDPQGTSFQVIFYPIDANSIAQEGRNYEYSFWRSRSIYVLFQKQCFGPLQSHFDPAQGQILLTIFQRSLRNQNVFLEGMKHILIHCLHFSEVQLVVRIIAYIVLKIVDALAAQSSANIFSYI